MHPAGRPPPVSLSITEKGIRGVLFLLYCSSFSAILSETMLKSGGEGALLITSHYRPNPFPTLKTG